MEGVNNETVRGFHDLLEKKTDKRHSNLFAFSSWADKNPQTVNNKCTPCSCSCLSYTSTINVNYCWCYNVLSTYLHNWSISYPPIFIIGLLPVHLPLFWSPDTVSHSCLYFWQVCHVSFIYKDGQNRILSSGCNLYVVEWYITIHWTTGHLPGKFITLEWTSITSQMKGEKTRRDKGQVSPGTQSMGGFSRPW